MPEPLLRTRAVAKRYPVARNIVGRPTSYLDAVRGVDLEIAEVEIGPSSRYVGQTFRNSKMRSDFGLIVLAIKRDGQMQFNPGPEDRMNAGDFLIAIGESAGLRKLEEAAGK